MDQNTIIFLKYMYYSVYICIWYNYFKKIDKIIYIDHYYLFFYDQTLTYL